MNKVCSNSQKLILPMKTFSFPSQSIKLTRKIYDSKPNKIGRSNTSLNLSIQDSSCILKVQSLDTSFIKPSLCKSRIDSHINPLFSCPKLFSSIESRPSSKLSNSRSRKTNNPFSRSLKWKMKPKNHVQSSVNKNKETFQDWDLDESFTVGKPCFKPAPNKTKILASRTNKKVVLAWIPQTKLLTVAN